MNKEKKSGNNAFLLGAALATVMAFGIVAKAQAGLIQRDLATAGDGLLAYDSLTDLEWLQFSFTKNRGFMDIVDEIGTLAGGGFRVAVQSEVTTLYNHAGFDPLAVSSSEADHLAAAQLLHALLGLTQFSDRSGTLIRSIDSYQEAWVLPDDTGDPLVYRALLQTSETHLVSDGSLLTHTASAQFTTFGCNPDIACRTSTFGAGAYLVRTATTGPDGGSSANVPEPSTLTLLPGALGLLVLWRRRARQCSAMVHRGRHAIG